ncbi:MAG: LysM peptidoglycan-binding domain-containing protein [Thioploca sp.]|nr:LysM peptidoglycan-binding domain-containing protein [Thioploca sp.]
MYWPIVSVRLGVAFGFITVLLLAGCPSVPTTPSTTEPQTPLPPSQPSSTSPTVETEMYHTVVKGETLYGIATRYGRNYKDVAQWNNIPSPYILSPGQRLLVSGPSENMNTLPESPITPGIPIEPNPIPKPTPMVTPADDNEDQHIVQAGETLYAIATRYGYNFRDVAAWNNIEPPYNLKVGQVLIISPPPGWQPNSGTTLSPRSSLSPSPTTPLPVQPSIEPTAPVAEGEDYHIVQPGDTLFSLARHYGFGVVDIAAWNGLQPPYNLKAGQQLRITPPEDVPISTPANKEGEGNNSDSDQANYSDYHVVSTGETLYSIARNSGHSVEELAAWNRLESPYYLSLGQKLRLTSPSELQTQTGNYVRTSSETLLSRPNHHVVKDKETMSSIAKQYGLSVDDLAEWNGIGSPYTVFPGLTLKLTPH